MFDRPMARGDGLPGFLDFFAGSGLVCEALRGIFRPVWANDVCPRKAAVYVANHGAGHFHLGSIVDVRGVATPQADLSWASFPCQDVSLAGNLSGLAGARSGLVWEWLRVIREQGAAKPPVLALENVVGLVTSRGGRGYREIHQQLGRLGYKAGAMVLDAVRWLPQSRPRIFVVAVPKDADTGEFEDSGPNWLHPKAVVQAADGLEGWVWWKIPEPSPRTSSLADILEWDVPCDDAAGMRHTLDLIPEAHRARLLEGLDRGLRVAPGYKRTRERQVLELRFDGVAGCLRTPKGGSSRQYVVLKRGGELAARLLTVREAARLMGAPDSYKIPGRYNDGYGAMGDAVATPPVRHLAGHLLKPLVSKRSAGSFSPAPG